MVATAYKLPILAAVAFHAVSSGLHGMTLLQPICREALREECEIFLYIKFKEKVLTGHHLTMALVLLFFILPSSSAPI